MKKLFKDLNIDCQFDAPLAGYTWYNIGGPAKVLAKPANLDQLAAIVKRCHENNVKIYMLGSGANLLVPDEGVGGVVIKLDHPNFKKITINGCTATAGGGADLAKLVIETTNAGLSGLEGLAGIPATVGGAVRMNAGGRFGEIGEAMSMVSTVGSTGQTHNYSKEDLTFEYRKSSIEDPFIYWVKFDLAAGDADACRAKVKQIMGYKKDVQPLAAKSAGCIFKNPPVEAFANQQPVGAGQLIDLAELKGFRIGGAEVSQQHANFIVAYPGCKSRDIVEVIEHVEQVVRKQFGVVLEREIVIW